MRDNKKPLFFIPILAAAAFCAANFARAADDHLVISEILVGGNSADEEFVELYNPTSADIDLKLLPLKLHIVSSTGTDTSKTLSYPTSNSTIKSHDYFILASPVFKENHPDIPVGATYSAALVSNGALYASASASKNLNVIDSACWGTSTKCDFPLPNPKSGYSLERIENGSDWQESCETGGTPGKKSKECPVEQPAPAPAPNPDQTTDPDASEDYPSSGKIYLNEIFPNPKNKSDEEYIEIANGGSEEVDLFGWKLKDASKSKGHQFKEHITLAPGEYLAIYKSDSKISLNNSSETVSLYDPQNELVSSATYIKTVKNSSYSFDGETWKWSKYLTPGAKNKFDSPPKIKIKRPKNVYKGIAAEFSADAKDKESKKLKYSWDFGDGKKSSLKKTAHKYLDTGKYTVALTVSDESQTVEKSFVVKVKNPSRPNLEIVKIVPNPTGQDSNGEIINIKNNSGKKVDLTGWKIATGSGEKMYNHPISRELIVNSGETKTITREFSKFSLGNKSGKVQLVMPDGKMVDEVSYSKEKITEDEAYVKNDGEWIWLVPDIEEGGISQEETEIIDDPTGEIEAEENIAEENEDAGGEVLGANDEAKSPVENLHPGFSSENAYAFLSHIGFGLPPTEQNFCPRSNYPFSIAFLLASSI